ncbi:MAG: Synechococcus phage Bellamy [Verrucomicrobiota bacterium]|jgi:hypothetical protein
MANPNIVNVTTIYGKTNAVNLTTTNASTVVTNPADSNAVFKINSLVVSNVNGSDPASITISLYSNANIGGTATEICRTVAVPADATLVVIDKTTSIYLEENRSIGAVAGSANDLKIICSYEEIY